MKILSRAALFPLALALSSPAVAAEDGQIWTNATATVKLSDHWRLSEDLTLRFSDDRDGLYEVESNTLLGYKLNKVTTVWAGYTHDPQYNARHFTIMENRAREQVTFDGFARIGTGKLSGRVRLEQRWRENLDGTGWRVRPYLKYTLPFRQGGKTALVVSTEPFFNLNTNVFQRKEGLDRIRTLVGVSAPVAKTLTFEFGYLNQHAFIARGPDNDDHVASLSLALNL